MWSHLAVVASNRTKLRVIYATSKAPTNQPLPSRSPTLPHNILYRYISAVIRRARHVVASSIPVSWDPVSLLGSRVELRSCRQQLPSLSFLSRPSRRPSEAGVRLSSPRGLDKSQTHLTLAANSKLEIPQARMNDRWGLYRVCRNPFPQLSGRLANCRQQGTRSWLRSTPGCTCPPDRPLQLNLGLQQGSRRRSHIPTPAIICDVAGNSTQRLQPSTHKGSAFPQALLR